MGGGELRKCGVGCVIIVYGMEGLPLPGIVKWAGPLTKGNVLHMFDSSVFS